jgi:hypothetical protein
MSEAGAPAVVPSYDKRKRMIRDKIVARELSTTPSQTRLSPSTPWRFRASVKYSGRAARGNGSAVIAIGCSVSNKLNYDPFGLIEAHLDATAIV